MESRGLIIVTYNIAGNNNTYWSNHEEHVIKLVDFFRDLEADVICLQEVSGKTKNNTQAHQIANLLKMNCIFRKSMKFESGLPKYYGLAILSYFPIYLINPIELPRGSLLKDNGVRMPGQNEKRLALCVRISPMKNDKSFDFICICSHFGIYNSEDDKNNLSLKPVKRIRKYINNKSTDNDKMPALLVGDFNTIPDSNIYKFLDRNWNMHKTEETVKGKKIDYICDRGRGRYIMEKQEVKNEITLSDHYPLVGHWSFIMNKKNNSNNNDNNNNNNNNNNK
jgi:endonuclease/exonuclease/phosphatase family metal-dependent hydrolase